MTSGKHEGLRHLRGAGRAIFLVAAVVAVQGFLEIEAHAQPCSPPSCSDGNPCTNDICSAGVCANPPNGNPCNDGNPCTRSSACSGGVCAGFDPVLCFAPDDCHSAGSCNSATGTCVFPLKANGTACNDSNPCTTMDICQEGSCTGGGNLQCPMPDQCHEPVMCVAATGMCPALPAKADGTSCEDGNQCTVGDKCKAGSCTAGGGRVCDDGKMCTSDSCTPTQGCIFVVGTPGCLEPPDGGSDALPDGPGDVAGDGLDDVAQPDLPAADVSSPDLPAERSAEVGVDVPGEARTPDTATEEVPRDMLATPADATGPPADMRIADTSSPATPDAARPADAGKPAGDSGGCSCAVNGVPRTHSLLPFVGGLGILLVARVRRRASRRSRKS